MAWDRPYTVVVTTCSILGAVLGIVLIKHSGPIIDFWYDRHSKSAR